MEHALPVVVIVLAEIIAILVIALGMALFLHIHKNRRHRAELNAVMGIARHVDMSAPVPGHAPTSEPPDTEFIARTNQSIGDIHEAIARLDVKLGQIHRDDQLHDEGIDHRVEEENAQVLALRAEVQVLTAALHELKQQHATLVQDLHTLRVGMEHHAQHNAQTIMKGEAIAAQHGFAITGNEFSLPDSLLAELVAVEKSAAVAVSAARAGTVLPAAAADTASVTAQQPVTQRAAALTQKIPRRTPGATKPREATIMAKTGTVDEPQYAFDPTQVDNSFNVPYFIPGAANTGINVEELDFEDLSLETRQALADIPDEQSQFDADRVFYQASPQTGIKAGWYFTLRGGKAHGPFGSKEAGERVLNEMIEHFKRNGDAGGR